MTEEISSIASVRYWARSFLGRHKHLYRLLLCRRNFRERIAKHDTDVVIDGFPRCGNSSFVRLFRFWNREAEIAHHVHLPCQIRCAVGLEIPTIVLIRDPLHAIASLNILDPRIALNLQIRSYTDFYQAVLPLRSRFVLGRFDTMTQSPDNLVKELNAQFGTDFQHFDLDPPQLEELFSRLKSGHAKRGWAKYLLAVPSEAKEAAKQKVLREIRTRAEFEKARRIYDKLMQS